MAHGQTPSQTVGPFFHYGLTPDQSGYELRGLVPSRLDEPSVSGDRIRISGRVLDGRGEPISDALLEFWQADAAGRYAHPADARGANTPFRGFARVPTDKDGRWEFHTIKPAPIGDGQAPHITVILFSRGSQNHLYTRIYFSDAAEANDRDRVLASVPADRRGTLIARRTDADYNFDIRVQGGDETVFFDV
jgi:protocatechuate 3,4-dioxygenase, alpha subunit